MPGESRPERIGGEPAVNEFEFHLALTLKISWQSKKDWAQSRNLSVRAALQMAGRVRKPSPVVGIAPLWTRSQIEGRAPAGLADRNARFEVGVQCFVEGSPGSRRDVPARNDDMRNSGRVQRMTRASPEILRGSGKPGRMVKIHHSQAALR